MANKMRYRWGPLVLKWIDKTTTVDVEQGDMMKWAAGGTITPCTASGDATELVGIDRKSTRLNSSHIPLSRMPSSA